MTNPPFDDDIQIITDLDKDPNKAIKQLADKVNEVVRSANKNHGKPYKVINGKVDLFMNNKTNDHESQVLRWVFNPAIPITQPTGVFIALFTSDPGENGVVTSEVSISGTGYSRVSCLFDTPANGFTVNVGAVQFPTSLASWGNVTHVGICRGNTRGIQDLMYYGPLSTAVNINAANFSPQFAPGTITVSEKPLIASLAGILQGNGTFTGTIAPSTDLDVSTEQDYVPRPSKVTLPLTIMDVKDNYPGASVVNLTDTGNVTTNATNLRNALNTSLISASHVRIRLPDDFVAKFSTPLEPSGPHTNANIWTIIEWTNKPTAGYRVTPGQMKHAPKIITTAVSSAFLMRNGANNVRIIGVEIYTETTNNFGLVLQGQGETVLASIPTGMIIDRCYIHGNGLQCQHGVTLNGTYGAVINCYITDIKWAGVETQAVNGYAGPGPFRIDNNFLYAASISVLFGGAEPNIIGLHPADIVVRRNHGWKPLSLKGTGNVAKNQYEIKHAQRILFEANVAENSWEEAQAGMLFNFQTLGASWNESKDVTCRYNEGRNGCEFVVCSARGFDGIAMKMNRVDINNNFCTNIGFQATSTSRGVLLTADLDTVYAEHNSLFRNYFRSGVPYIFDRASGAQAANIKIRSNIGGPSAASLSTVFQSGGNVGNAAISDYGGATSDYLNNLGFQEPLPSRYTVPPNAFAADSSVIKIAPNGKLLAASPYLNMAIEGTDPGANITDLETALANVEGLPVIPGVYGFGTYTPAGRRGQIIRVTNLNDSGAGSFRAAVTASGPRVVCFEVSGMITLLSKIVITEPFLTIAGQTAPAPGIGFRNFGISIRASDVLVQHLRVRHGKAAVSTGNNDAWEILGPNARRIVLDHCSGCWGVDENYSIWSTDDPLTPYSAATDVTFHKCIMSEALSTGSGNLLIGDTAKNIAVIKCFMAHNWDRDPYFKGNTSGVSLNNFIYNSSGNQVSYVADPGPGGTDPLRGPSVVVFAGNALKRGPSSPAGLGQKFTKGYVTNKDGTAMFVYDNRDSGANGGLPPADPWNTALVQNDLPTAGMKTYIPPIWPRGYVLLDSGVVQAAVLADVGAWKTNRDSVDTRVINDAINGTGSASIASESDVGGYPTLANNTRTLETAGLPATPNADTNGNGYTDLEEWLQGLAAAIQ